MPRSSFCSNKRQEKKSSVPTQSGVRRHSVSPDDFATAARSVGASGDCSVSAGFTQPRGSTFESSLEEGSGTNSSVIHWFGTVSSKLYEIVTFHLKQLSSKSCSSKHFPSENDFCQKPISKILDPKPSTLSPQTPKHHNPKLHTPEPTHLHARLRPIRL